MRHAEIAELRAALLHSDPRALGEGSRAALDRGIRDRRLHRVRRGAYLPMPLWDALWAESKHRAHVVAVAAAAHGTSPVFSHESAAVLHGLPLWRMSPSRVHVLIGSVDRHSVPDLLRHEGALPDDDIVERDGMRFTSLERTVYDVARTFPAESALAAADAAAAHWGRDPRAFREELAQAWIEQLRRRVDAAPGARGIRQARAVVDMVDGRAQLPLESVTRLHLARLGFARPRVQVPIRAPLGGTYWVDIGLDDVGAFIEVDGRTKYTDETLRAGSSLEDVLLAEKQREDWIRGTTGSRLARVSDEHVTSASALGRRLAAFHILPPTHPVWRDRAR